MFGLKATIHCPHHPLDRSFIVRSFFVAMGSYQKLDQPLPTIQEVPELEVVAMDVEARERRLRDREADLEARERRLNELEDIEQKYLKMVGKAAARRAAPEVSWAHEEAVEKTRDAIRSMEAVEKECGHDLENSRRLLEGPSAKSAASALMDLESLAKSCDKGALAAIKAAERAVRDVVVLRCCSQGEEKDRGAFLEAAKEAFGRPLDRELRAKLLLAASKIFEDQPDTFPSNTKKEAERRGGRKRSKRLRPSVVGATTKEQLEREPMYVSPLHESAREFFRVFYARAGP